MIANSACEEMGMRLPTVEEAEVIAQRILDIRNALDIKDEYPFQSKLLDSNPNRR